jgi:uncharacterized protein with GYD domain
MRAAVRLPAASRFLRLGAISSSRRAAYRAYGDDDVFVIVDLPDTAAATGLALALGRTGSFHVTTTVLLTGADMDAGAGKSPTCRAPGA